MDTYYIYCHFDKDGIPRYIGKSKEDIKLKRAYNFSCRTKEWKNFFKNSIPDVKILESRLDKENSFEREGYWINYYGKIKDNGTLLNLINSYNPLERKTKYKEKLKKYSDNYYLKNKEEKRKYYLTNKQKVKNYYQLNKELLKEKSRIYYLKKKSQNG